MTDPIDRPDKPLFPAQKPWHVFLLMTLSLGLYTFFFAYIHARDLKRLGHDTKPWLWVLAPLVALPMLIAMPRLGERWASQGERLGLEIRNRGLLAGGAYFTYSAITGLADSFFYGYSGLTLLALLPLIGFAFASVTKDLNQVRAALPEDWFHRSHNELTPGGWGWLTAGVIIGIPILSLVAFDEIRQLNRVKLPTDSAWVHASGAFSVSATTGDWSVAEPGTFGDETSLAEFSMTDVTYLAVYDQSSATVQGTAEGRRSIFREVYDSPDCERRTWLEASTLERRSETLCTASFFGEPIVLISTIIDTEGSIYEVVGESQMGSRIQQDDMIEALRTLTAGFSIEMPETESSEPDA